MIAAHRRLQDTVGGKRRRIIAARRAFLDRTILKTETGLQGMTGSSNRPWALD